MCIVSIRHLLITIVLLAAALPARANETYLSGFEAANPHLRMAISYLRTGNSDLAAIEIETFQAKWTPLDDRLPAGRLKSTVKTVAAAAKSALDSVDSGKLDEARKTLLDARQKLYEANKTENLSPFADCIWGAIKTGYPLWSYRDPAPDLKDPAIAKKIISINNAYLDALRGCRKIAPKDVAEDSEYTRLMDNADNSLSAIPGSINAGDGGQLYRYLIELRSIDRLLYFRFG
ncbi:MAG: hypothetical protein AB7G34_10340 [Hyphomicrobiales bacterium]